MRWWEMDIPASIAKLLERAIDMRASDIHVEPQKDGLRIRFRIDGFLTVIDRIPSEWMWRYVSRLKVMGHLDIGEKRLPQDGAMTIRHRGEKVDVRISTMPTVHGEKVVLRLLRDRPDGWRLAELGMDEPELSRVTRLIDRPHGLIVVTGPTGAGKTTTLYAMLRELNRPETNIVTLEDPVEFQMEGVNQIQIHPKAGFTFAAGLRAVLRQDPNVIMVGEIRDRETADIAVRAAMTGHLVLSTLHTPDALGSITRLLDMGVEPYRVAATLIGAVAQRLVRRVCGSCGGEGCPDCQQTGYRGRTGVFEVITVDEALSRGIAEGWSSERMRKHLLLRGVRTIADRVKERAASGLTTLEECHRVVEFSEEMEVVGGAVGDVQQDARSPAGKWIPAVARHRDPGGTTGDQSRTGRTDPAKVE
ncbi:GspE/PulE family protein [Polycladomyces zharkentensis]|uniref:GspE/PulE family protein n=1 Tax=Polycladomyces zharkentensis TaxID=2807616 RepID=UPI00265EEF5D|nr:GspE/PulE family protein [Polycladomyces sp. WAk]